jgi:hypothetical protein
VCQTLASHVQSSSSSNANSKVSVDGITKNSDGTLSMAYTCSGAGDTTSAQSSLKSATSTDTCQKVISQCCSSQTGATTQKVEVTTAKASEFQEALTN